MRPEESFGFFVVSSAPSLPTQPEYKFVISSNFFAYSDNLERFSAELFETITGYEIQMSDTCGISFVDSYSWIIYISVLLH